MNVVRRHSRGGADSSDGFHYGPAVRIITGNYVTGKRRGVVDGIDFGATGSGVLRQRRCLIHSLPSHSLALNKWSPARVQQLCNVFLEGEGLGSSD